MLLISRRVDECGKRREQCRKVRCSAWRAGGGDTVMFDAEHATPVATLTYAQIHRRLLSTGRMSRIAPEEHVGIPCPVRRYGEPQVRDGVSLFLHFRRQADMLPPLNPATPCA